MLDIYVDGDACPVKDEVYRVAGRFRLRTIVVANGFVAVPVGPSIERVIVGDRLDEADDWIAERIGTGDICITGDIPLAGRCVEKGARVLDGKGRLLDSASIGEALAMRNLMTSLREAGTVTGGPRPYAKEDRSRFLGALDSLIRSIARDALRTAGLAEGSG